MAINPNVLRKILKEVLKNLPIIIDGINKARQKLTNRKKALPESESLSEDVLPTAQEFEKKVDIFHKSLQKHVKIINSHSKMLNEQRKIIEEITIQSENLAIQSKNLATLVNMLIWITGISFVMAIAAILIAILK